ncbi:MAG: hypothetical protein JNK82_45745 [Myxococcaceae bacterium]|nr:hypothetical protein [Myxococcaceae bacterium]
MAVVVWAGVLGPAFALLTVLAVGEPLFAPITLLCALPSMLVSLAASRVARHTAAR